MSFSIEFKWIPRQFGELLDQETFAELKIVVGDHVLTRLLDENSQTVRESIYVSAMDVAEWLVMNWWRLRWEPQAAGSDWDMAHRLPAIGQGYVWPDISFSSDWNAVLIDAFPRRERVGLVQFLFPELHVAIPVKAFEKEVDRFVSAVLSRVRDKVGIVNERSKILCDLWDELRTEWSNPELTRWRKLEAMAGFDPGEAPDQFYQVIPEAELKWGLQAVEELAATARNETPELIDQIKRLPESSKETLHFADLIENLGTIKLISREGEPWVRGHEMAKKVRKKLGLDVSPLSTKDFAELAGVSPRYLQESSISADLSIDAGFRSTHSKDVKCVLRGKRETSRRFAMARLVGDEIFHAGKEPLLPLTKAKTSRQKFQRAFAQELLCPLEGVLEITGLSGVDDDRVEMASDYFQVSPMTIRTTLVNRMGYSRESLDRYVIDFD